MISFEWPMAFLALPLPLLARYALPTGKVAEEAALRVPSLDPFGIDGINRLGTLRAQGWLLLLATLAWLLLITAMARPQWTGDAIELPVSGRELMLAVDLSGSMQTEDFVINDQQVMRLEAVKAIAGEFITRRIGDRIGLILFGSQAYVQTPLTFDRTTVNTLLQESAIGLAGDSTAIGDAVGLATKRLRQNPEGNKVLILLTDGASNAGEVDPIKAAELAAKEGLTIYTIGIGAETMEVQTLFGKQRVKVPNDLDEKTLTAIAEATGGRYFRARDAAQLNEIYATLNQLQPVKQDKESFRPRQALFFWPLSLAVLLAALILFVKARSK